MSETSKIPWNESTQKKFEAMSAKIPWALRKVASEAVLTKLAQSTLQNKRNIIEDKDLIDAFFAATPSGFHGPMMNDMEELGLDYKACGHPIEAEGWGKPKYD